MTLNLLNL